MAYKGHILDTDDSGVVSVEFRDGKTKQIERYNSFANPEDLATYIEGRAAFLTAQDQPSE